MIDATSNFGLAGDCRTLERADRGASVPAANITDDIAHSVIVQTARSRETGLAGTPSKIWRKRCVSPLPGIAIPTTRTRLPSWVTERAMSSR